MTPQTAQGAAQEASGGIRRGEGAGKAPEGSGGAQNGWELLTTPTLTVIAGGPGTGKSLMADALVAYRPCRMITRDEVREMLAAVTGATPEEWAVTLATAKAARVTLLAGRDALCVGWNLEGADRRLWTQVAAETGATLRWVLCEMPDLPTGGLRRENSLAKEV